MDQSQQMVTSQPFNLLIQSVMVPAGQAAAAIP
jgi:hypothetical protein